MSIDLDADDIFGDRDPMAEPKPVAPKGPHAQHISEVMQDVADQLSAGPPKVLPTPFPGVNQLLDGGFRAGELIFMGARPSVGKTAVALEMARYAANGVSVLVVSREMVNAALARRMVAQEGRVPSSALRQHNLSPDQMRAFVAGWERLASLDLWLTEDAASLADIQTLVTHPPDKVKAWGFVVVDYLQLLRPPPGQGDRRSQVEALSAGLKTLAKSAKVPVLCLASLRRPMGDKPARPTMADLKESSNLEHDADIIFLMHRDDPAEGPKSTIVELNVSKNRDGQTGPVMLHFSPQFVSFSERDFEREW